MKSFTLNREFFIRHLGVTLLMAALGCWFVYDGSVVYPKMDAVEFCEKHHKNVENAEQEKVNAIKRQYQFASLAFIAALAICALYSQSPKAVRRQSVFTLVVSVRELLRV